MDLLPGTLDLLVLRILDDEPLHGYAVARRIESLSEDALSVEQGSLYPALYRLERSGLVRSRRETSDTGRRVKVYALTAAGRGKLADEVEGWDRFVEAVGRVVRGYQP
jgi:PadR family transcriptional regulator PadR